MTDTTIVTADGEAVEYRDVPGFPGYRVGSDGSVWSCWKRAGRGPGGGAGSIFVISTDWRRLKTRPSEGYPGVTLYRNQQQNPVCVHRITMLAFVGPCPEGMQVAHENGNRADCRLTNLTYKTPADNQKDRLRHGTHQLGEKNQTSTVTEAVVRSVREAHARGGRTITDIAAQHGIKRHHASMLIRRKIWSHI